MPYDSAYKKLIEVSEFNISFMPSHEWFIFRIEDGKTMFKGFASKRSAEKFLIYNQGEFNKE